MDQPSGIHNRVCDPIADMLICRFRVQNLVDLLPAPLREDLVGVLLRGRDLAITIFFRGRNGAGLFHLSGAHCRMPFRHAAGRTAGGNPRSKPGSIPSAVFAGKLRWKSLSLLQQSIILSVMPNRMIPFYAPTELISDEWHCCR